MRKKRKNKSTTQSTSLNYSGDVTIKVVRDNKVVQIIDGHNHGNVRLFDFITTCLCGLYEDTLCPKFLNVFHVENSSDTNVTSNMDSLTGIIPIASSLSTSGDSSSTANLTFTIPGELFNGTSQSPNLFALYSKKEIDNQTNPCAVIYLETNLTNITSDTNLILVWKLNISNMSNE